MDFASDNIVGASETIVAALAEAARAGAGGTYGADSWSTRARARLDEVFERKVTAFFVATGTAANALALQAITPPGQAAFCHETAHVIEEECGAPEFFIGAGKLVGVPGVGGKMTPEGLAATLARFPRGVVRQVPPGSLSLSQATECGTAYSLGEIAALTGLAHEAGLRVHMDGARFANAMLELGCTPAEMTWKAGVDVLAFGATKNGALACEAVIFFDEAHAAGTAVACKRGGHIVSKGRLLGAQMDAYLADDHWLALARHANAMADKLARGLAEAGLALPWPRQANEVFVLLPDAVDAALQGAGAHYYPWITTCLPPGPPLAPGTVLARLICSYETTPAQVEALLQAARSAVG